MTLTKKILLQAELGWRFEENNVHGQHTEHTHLKKQTDFSSVSLSADATWLQKNISLPAYGTHLYDLESLPQEIFQNYFYLRFSSVNTFFIINHSSQSPLQIGAASESTWNAFLGGNNQTLQIPASGFLCISSESSAWSVTASENILKIYNPSEYDASYDLAFIGKKYQEPGSTSSPSSSVSGTSSGGNTPSSSSPVEIPSGGSV
ncbi:MAG: hypothetical protein Q4C96_00175 [Planctomycetia bacterium]|nr:hypothetical protein [Planctomycetia bacterium]